MSRSECTACLLVFSTARAFDKHRIGSFGESIVSSTGATHYSKYKRRCLTIGEMIQKSMKQNEKGWWTTGEFDEAASSRMKGKRPEK